ncbi:MAG: ABC transporter substrate-binding protein [Pseudoflavonifractor sp.]
MNNGKLTALTLALALTLSLAGCTTPAVPTPTPPPSPAPTATATPTPAPTATPTAERTPVSIAMLKGPTGMGAAKLMADDEAGSTANDYTFTLAAAPDEIVGKIVSGEFDLAAVPTNLAATLAAKTKGGVQVIALNTLGVLYILEKGDSVKSMADLKGKTIYATGQAANPEYVLNHLLVENGLTPGSDVTIVWKTSEELTALMASGEIDLCMLPVPAATAVLMKNKDLRPALDLTREWDALKNGSTLTMGCVVAQTKFIAEHPEALASFLADYAASIDYVKNSAEAPALVAQFGITPNEQIAKAAIPQANLVCITGGDMQPALQGYYEVLWQAEPKSIGGSIPNDTFYYAP